MFAVLQYQLWTSKVNLHLTFLMKPYDDEFIYLKQYCMKTKLLFIALWLTTLPLLTQAGTSWQTATTITSGQTLKENLSDNTKEAWFKFTATGDGYIDLTCKPSSGLSLRYITLYSLYNNNTMQRGATWVGSESKTLRVNNLAAGTYYVKVERDNGQGSFSLSCSFTLTDNSYLDDGEPNNNFSQSKTLSINGSRTGHIGYFYWNDTDNEDWFNVTVPEDGTIELTCTPAQGLSMRYITLYSLSNNATKQRGAAWVGAVGTTLVIKNVAKGKYYVKVERDSGEGGYTISSKFTPTSKTHADDGEPNNNFSQSKTLPINGSITGHIGYLYWDDTDKEDWYNITVPEDGTIELTCTPANGLSMRYITLYSLANNETKQRGAIWVGAQGATLTVNDLAKGKYYVKVERDSGEGGYTISSKFTRTSDTYLNDKESNDNFSGANVLHRGHPITGHLGYLYWADTDSKDWYKIEVPRDGIAKLTCTPAQGLSMRYIRLYSLANNETKQRGSIWVGAEGATLTVNDVAPGTYYVMVERDGGVGGYKLSYDLEQNRYATDLEPNNEWQKAVPLDQGKTVAGHLGYFYWNDIDNTDFYQVKVSKKGTITFVCEPSNDLSMRYITLYKDGKSISAKWIGSEKTTLTIDNVEAGTYQIGLERDSGVGYYLLAYDTKLGSVNEQEQLPDDVDNGVPGSPNGSDTWESSDQIVSGQTTEGGLSSQKKDAWYKVIVKEDGTLKATLKLDSKLDIYFMELCYIGQDGKAARRYDSAIDLAPNQKGTLTVNDLAPGTYYLHINHFSGDGKYTLTYVFEPNGYDNDKESNDTWQEAQYLARNNSVTGHLGYQYFDNPDVTDWYKINVPRDGKVTLTLTQHDNLDIYYMSLNAIDENGVMAERNYIDNGTNAENKIEVSDVAAGTYYVRVERYSGPGGYTLDYRFKQDEYATDVEPNNTWNSAQTLVDGEPTSAHLGYYMLEADRDVDDWYAIYVPQKSTVELAIKLSQTVDILYMTMYQEDGTNVKEYSGGSIDAYFGEEKKLTIKDVEAGTYYVCVHHYAGNGNYLIGYNCKVDGVKPQDEPPVEPYNPGNNDSGTTNGYFFAWLNNGMYTAYPLAHKPKLTMSGTTFTLTTTQTNVTYQAKDVMKFTLSDINGNTLDIGKVFSGRIAPTVEKSADALSIKGCVPGTNVAVLNMEGKVFSQGKTDSNGDATISLSELPKGVYLVRTGTTTIKITRK